MFTGSLAYTVIRSVSIRMETQLKLKFPETVRELETGEDPAFLTRQIITYLGNKRSLLDFIAYGVKEIRRRSGKEKLKVFDVFSGSGIVARYLKQFSRKLIVNDLERYAEVINKCYLSNYSEIKIESLRDMYREIILKLETMPLKEGFIADYYAPKNDTDIQDGERVFYTTRNARYLDTARQYIGEIDQEWQHFFLAPLLSEASVHANTSGVFKGFYKNKETGRGWFGGKKEDALKRIKGDIRLPFPLFSRYECDVQVFRGDAVRVAEEAPPVDMAYLDPPYNQHPYGSNYFMLNLLVDYRKPERISKVSGIPEKWNRSPFNNRSKSREEFAALVKTIKARFLLVSFNSEGFISLETMKDILQSVGDVFVFERKYNTFRGSRNLGSRTIHVKEYLYLVEKKEYGR